MRVYNLILSQVRYLIAAMLIMPPSTQGIIAQTSPIKFRQLFGSEDITLGKINAIAQDQYGFLWLSDQTNGCIIRYDGQNYKPYCFEYGSSNSLGGSYPECLAFDSSGILWIGLYGMGIDRFDPVAETFTHFENDPEDDTSLGNNTVSSILVDHLGILWVGHHGGVDMMNMETGAFYHFAHDPADDKSLSPKMVKVVYEDSDGNIWVGTGSPWDGEPEGGLNRFNREDSTFTRFLHDPQNNQSLADNAVRALHEDSRGNFWIGTPQEDGLHTLERISGEVTRYPYSPNIPGSIYRPFYPGEPDHITFLEEDAKGNLWIGSVFSGINYFDFSSGTISHFGGNPEVSGGIPENSSWWAHASDDGMVWITTQDANLYQADIYTYEFPFYETGLVVESFHPESEDIVWIATSNGAIRKDLSTNSSERILHDARNDSNNLGTYLTDITSDPSGRVWIGTVNQGLYSYDSETKKLTHFPSSDDAATLMNPRVTRLICNDSSSIWISTYGGGLSKLNLTDLTFEHYQANPSDSSALSYDVIYTMEEGAENDLWLAIAVNRGIERFDIETGTTAKYLSNIRIQSIYKDQQDRIWAGGGSGLYLYDTSVDDFLPLKNSDNEIVIQELIHTITSDQRGNLWICAFTGIFKLDPETKQVFRYTKEYGIDGLHESQAKNGPDNTIYIGSTTGYYAFHPDSLFNYDAESEVLITSFSINDQKVVPGKGGILEKSIFETSQINLKYNQNSFSFKSTKVDFRTSRNEAILYMLENYDSSWGRTYAGEEVKYSRIPAGKYALHIKSANSRSGIWSQKTIDLIVLPPWWRTWWAYVLYILLAGTLLYFIDRFQRNRLLAKERALAKEKELAHAREIEKAYEELKTTQNQLIHSEKMASLGELTAGIAHEIQNPLNFVNNFSEVSDELIDEAIEELTSTPLNQLTEENIEEAQEILNDLKGNLEKINHHGHRASSIVKGMLQHSRVSSGEKELTDINQLCDEYMRLAYHGLRAKDSNFNCKMEMDFDESIGKVNVIPQDFGRVLLNLITNAFQACALRQAQDTALRQAQDTALRQAQGTTLRQPSISSGQIAQGTAEASYMPEVVVTTRRLSLSADKAGGVEVEVRVSDNGNGIPEEIQDKIFQPFFTTKPTGEGTGLGLSMSYDIITKGHGGTLTVESEEGEGSEFTITLPIQAS